MSEMGMFSTDKEAEVMKLKEKLLIEQQKRFLKRMQPHFLYNTLQSIEELILIDPERAAELLDKFTIYLRFVMKGVTEENAIPFEEELSSVKAYLSIQQMRMGKMLSVEYEINDSDFQIVPLSLIPLVDNSIRHGIYAKDELRGVIRIVSDRKDDLVIVRVEDDGIGFDIEVLERTDDCEQNQKGLQDLAFRLKQIQNAMIEIKSKPGQGTGVMIQIEKQDRMN